MLSDAEREHLQVIAPEASWKKPPARTSSPVRPCSAAPSTCTAAGLPRSATGHVDTGLGKQQTFGGDIGILEPTEIVSKTGQRIDVDGVEMVFQYTPASEAPAEMTFYIPQYKGILRRRVVSHTLHNLYTLRGAKVRDALKWKWLHRQSHHPVRPGRRGVFRQPPLAGMGQGTHQQLPQSQRDTYKFIHDQTLRLANAGYTPKEISAELKLPSTLEELCQPRLLRHRQPQRQSGFIRPISAGMTATRPTSIHCRPPKQAPLTSKPSAAPTGTGHCPAVIR